MITEPVRAFLIREFFRGEPADALGLDDPLISSGLLDSVATLRLVLFLESEFHITIESADIANGQLDTIHSIESLVTGKLSTHSPG